MVVVYNEKEAEKELFYKKTIIKTKLNNLKNIYKTEVALGCLFVFSPIPISIVLGAAGICTNADLDTMESFTVLSIILGFVLFYLAHRTDNKIYDTDKTSCNAEYHQIKEGKTLKNAKIDYGKYPKYLFLDFENKNNEVITKLINVDNFKVIKKTDIKEEKIDLYTKEIFKPYISY